MAIQGNPSRTEKDGCRKRKAHKKSRSGCHNCKLRRVKCDEGRPSCERCHSYRVACDYDSSGSDDLMSSMTGTFNINPVVEKSLVLNHAITQAIQIPSSLPLIRLPETSLIRQLKVDDLDLLSKFQRRTVLTMGTPDSNKVYQREMVRLASGAPHLLHIVLSLTMLHDQLLNGTASADAKAMEAYHRYKGTSLFTQILSRPVREEDKDALWATAAMLGAVAFASIDAEIPEQAWPLRKPSESDLEWLKMSDGKKAVLKIVTANRSCGVFSEVMPQLVKNFNFVSAARLDAGILPDGFVKVFELDDESIVENNPYHAPAAILSQLLGMECTHHTILKFLGFISAVRPEYRRLLELKDPRALLLLTYWFASLHPFNQWWMKRRARLECQATCLFLQRYHSHETEIQRLLRFPMMACGLTTS